VSESEQGRLQGANHCLSSLAGIAGPILFGWIYAFSSQRHPGFAFYVAAAMVLGSLVCCGYATAPSRAKARMEGKLNA
jgi:DHA1 family tetracycline resistance protein-like MFS transporter